MKTKMITTIALAACMVVALLNTTAAAHPSQSGKRHGPPPAALKACEGRTEGDSVSFETPRGDTLEGTCKKIAGELAAVPENHSKGHPKPQREGSDE